MMETPHRRRTEAIDGVAPEEWEELDPSNLRISVAYNIDHGGAKPPKPPA